MFEFADVPMSSSGMCSTTASFELSRVWFLSASTLHTSEMDIFSSTNILLLLPSLPKALTNSWRSEQITINLYRTPSQTAKDQYKSPLITQWKVHDKIGKQTRRSFSLLIKVYLGFLKIGQYKNQIFYFWGCWEVCV